MKVLRVIIFLFFQISFGEFKILEKEQKVVKSLIDNLHVRRCLIINEFEHFASLTKSLSSDYVFSSVFNIEQLGDYIIPDDPFPIFFNDRDFPTKTAAVWKTDFHTFLFEFSIRLRRYQKFMSPYIWILIINSNFNDLEDLLQTYIPYNCKFLIINSEKGFDYTIFQAYNVKLVSEMTKVFGRWDAQNGLTLKDLKAEPDFQNEELFLTVYKSLIREKPILSKNLELWYDLGKMLNFTIHEITYEEAETRGLDTLLASQDLDATIIPIIKSYDKPGYARPMIYPLWQHKVYMHVQYKGNQITPLEALLRPFTLNVWKAVAFSFLISTLTIIGVEFFTLKINDDQCRTFHLIDSAFMPLEMYFNQGGCDPLDGSSPRISYLSLWIQILILLPAYTGAVASFLTMIIPRLPFNDLDTFIENGAYKFTAEDRTYLKGYFEIGKTKGNAKLSLINDKFFVNPLLMPKNLEDGVNQVCSDKNLVLLSYENEAFENLKEQPKCKLLQIPRPIFSMDAGLPLNKFTPFTTVFNKKFTYFRTSGIMQKLSRDIFKRRNELQFENYDPIEFSQILPLLTLFSVLTGISIFILLCEMFLKLYFH